MLALVEVAKSFETVLVVTVVLVPVEASEPLELGLTSVEAAELLVTGLVVTVVLVPAELAESLEIVLVSVEVAGPSETVLAVTVVLIRIKVAVSLKTVLVSVTDTRSLEAVETLALHDPPDDRRLWREGNASATLAASESRRIARILEKEWLG